MAAQYNISQKAYLSMLVLLTGTAFYGLRFLPQKFTWLLLPFSVLFFVKKLKSHSLFKWYIILFLLFAAFSAISCYHYRGQSLFLSFKAPQYSEYYLLLTYFIYLGINPSPKIVERVILITFGLFFFLYSIQYIVYPVKIVNIIAGEQTERFRIAGQIVNSLAFFLCLNRWFLHKGIANVIIMLCCLFVFFSLGFRMMLAAAFVSSAILFIKIFGFDIKRMLGVCLLFIVVGAVLSQTPLVQKTVQDMKDRQETDSYDNDDYIRIAQLAYYMEDHFYSETERFFGSGQPHLSSSYGKSMAYDEMSHDAMLKSGYNDWGLLGQSWLIGPVAIILFILMMIKCIRISWASGKEYFYIAAWYIFLLLISLNNMEVHRQGSMAYHSIVFYIVTYLYNKQNQQLGLQTK